jgi:hypothetical protein
VTFSVAVKAQEVSIEVDDMDEMEIQECETESGRAELIRQILEDKIGFHIAWEWVEEA